MAPNVPSQPNPLTMDPVVDDFNRRLKSAIEWENSQERKDYLKELDKKYFKKEKPILKVFRIALLIILMPFRLIIEGGVWIINSLSEI